MVPPFLFDFTFNKPKVSLIDEVSQPAVVPVPKYIDENNRCPYPVPSLDVINKLIGGNTYRVNKSQLISDVFECGAIALSNAVDLSQSKSREERYLQLIRGYKKPEQDLIATVFSRIYALLSSVVYSDGRFDDYLGKLFMQNNQGNSNAGQFFTPYHVSKFMALTMLDESVVRQKTADDGILTVSDPCCGGGGLLMAVLDVLNDLGVNYTRNCFMDAGDIDRRCVHMTYLQLSLAGVPAIVRHQNALTRELWGVWYTPAYLFQYPRFQKYVSLN